MRQVMGVTGIVAIVGVVALFGIALTRHSIACPILPRALLPLSAGLLDK
jgi:hypothetical protein